MTWWGQVPMAQLYDLTKVVQCSLLPENTCRIPYQKQCKSNFNKIPTIPGCCEVAAICDIANNSVHTRLDYESNPYTASFLKRMLQYCCVHCQVWIQHHSQCKWAGDDCSYCGSFCASSFHLRILAYNCVNWPLGIPMHQHQGLAKHTHMGKN